MTGRSVQRILVALDASAHSSAALQEAAALAVGLEAELHGIFVLDNELLRFSALPVARETGLTSAQRRSVDPTTMERSLKAQAEQARIELDEVARRHQLRSSFRLCRGDVVRELIEAGTQADMIAMGVIGHMNCTGKRLGSTAQQVRTQSRCSLLLLSTGYSPGAAVIVLCDRADQAEQILETARDLAERRQQNLVVLVPRGEPAAEARMRDQLGTTNVAVTFDTVDGFEELELLVRRHQGSLLIIGDDSALIEARDEELGGLGCPVLLTRMAGPGR